MIEIHQRHLSSIPNLMHQNNVEGKTLMTRLVAVKQSSCGHINGSI